MLFLLTKLFEMKKLFLPLTFILSQSFYGQFGINTATPKETLHVKGTMRYEPESGDPNQPLVGKTLVSDEYGNASWQIQDSRTTHLADYKAEPSDITFSITDDTTEAGSISPAMYTGTSITLPKGDWLVIFSLNAQGETQNSSGNWVPLTNRQAMWIRMILSSDTTSSNYKSSSDSNVKGGNLVSGTINGPATSTLIYGELFIRQPEASKTYYLKASLQGISAFPVPSAQNPVNMRIRNPAISPNVSSENKILAMPVNFTSIL
ncbi:hypothetical protein DRF57_20130 [Chryseobacterium rhizosphaerae]|jgi:hypothetical protein|uniref:T9SS C-terminal target domain-containing protein n=2 Tax=Chryseobacterium rhizosphaerae TaxID=395937 RepID=A0ABX9IFJ9_9FLAO|nr:hypothetical protein DRF57_20130 [Chryseobacterium rhizosphaerae]GEN69171.1 hypothetical protein CRH01_37390 [Chryseobacterium rhizosphaerae]